MPKYFATKADIAQLTSLNDVPIVELERRSRRLRLKPGASLTAAEFIDQEYAWDAAEVARNEEETEYVELLRSIRAVTGFLGDEEKLIARLASDFDALEALAHHFAQGLPTAAFYTVIAQNLRRIMAAAKEKVSLRFQEIPFVFDNSLNSNSNSNNNNNDINNNNDKKNEGSKVTLLVRHLKMRESQHGLFNNLESEKLADFWNEEFLIRNPSLDLEVLIAGNHEVGQVTFIEEYGFFQGENSPGANPYRVDPHVLMAVLTGKVSKAAVDRQLSVNNFLREDLIRLIKENEHRASVTCKEELDKMLAERDNLTRLERTAHNKKKVVERREYLSMEIDSKRIEIEELAEDIANQKKDLKDLIARNIALFQSTK